MRNKYQLTRLTVKERWKVCLTCLAILIIFGFVAFLFWNYFLANPRRMLADIQREYQRGNIIQMISMIMVSILYILGLPCVLFAGLMGFIQGLFGWRTFLTAYFVNEERETMLKLKRYENDQNAAFASEDREIVSERMQNLQDIVEDSHGVMTPEAYDAIDKEMRALEKANVSRARKEYWRQHKWAWLAFLVIGPGLFIACLLCSRIGTFDLLKNEWGFIIILGVGIGAGVTLLGMRSVIYSLEHVVVPTWLGFAILAGLLLGVIILVVVMNSG